MCDDIRIDSMYIEDTTVIVVELSSYVSDGTLDTIGKQLKQAFPKNKVLVLSPNMKITFVSKDDSCCFDGDDNES